MSKNSLTTMLNDMLAYQNNSFNILESLNKVTTTSNDNVVIVDIAWSRRYKNNNKYSIFCLS